MKEIILPNNRQILAIVDTNRKLLTDNERKVVEEFRQHVDDLEAKHLADSGHVASRFPPLMADIFTESANA